MDLWKNLFKQARSRVGGNCSWICQKNYLKKFCKSKSVQFVFFCSKIWKNFPTSIIRLVLFLMSTLGQIESRPAEAPSRIEIRPKFSQLWVEIHFGSIRGQPPNFFKVELIGPKSSKFIAVSFMHDSNVVRTAFEEMESFDFGPFSSKRWRFLASCFKKISNLFLFAIIQIYQTGRGWKRKRKEWGVEEEEVRGGRGGSEGCKRREWGVEEEEWGVRGGSEV